MPPVCSSIYNGGWSVVCYYSEGLRQGRTSVSSSDGSRSCGEESSPLQRYHAFIAVSLLVGNFIVFDAMMMVVVMTR